MSALAIFDIDGVIANFFGALPEYCLTKFNKEMPADDFWLERFLTKEEKDKLLHDEELFINLKPYDDTKEVLTRLKELGYRIILLSQRVVNDGATLLWLGKNRIPFDLFIRKDNGQRIEFIKKEQPTIYVDDRFGNVVKSISYCTYPFIIDHPWNRFENKDIIRIYSLSEIIDYAERDIEHGEDRTG